MLKEEEIFMMIGRNNSGWINLPTGKGHVVEVLGSSWQPLNFCLHLT